MGADGILYLCRLCFGSERLVRGDMEDGDLHATVLGFEAPVDASFIFRPT
jgi:hypothetical protein